MMLRYSFGLDVEADPVDEAVDRVPSSGYCTADLARSGGSVVTTKKMGTLIAEEL